MAYSKLFVEEHLKLVKAPNTACTGRWGVCAIYEHFPGFEFFLLPSRVHAHPSASNANRWAAVMEEKELLT